MVEYEIDTWWNEMIPGGGREREEVSQLHNLPIDRVPSHLARALGGGFCVTSMIKREKSLQKENHGGLGVKGVGR